MQKNSIYYKHFLPQLTYAKLRPHLLHQIANVFLNRKINTYST